MSKYCVGICGPSDYPVYIDIDDEKFIIETTGDEFSVMVHKIRKREPIDRFLMAWRKQYELR